MKLKEKGANSNNLRQLAKLDVEELRSCRSESSRR